MSLIAGISSIGWFVVPAVAQTGGRTPDAGSIREFAGGARVELIGIGNHDLTDQRWWDRSGKEARRPHHPVDGCRATAVESRDDAQRCLAFLRPPQRLDGQVGT